MDYRSAVQWGSTFRFVNDEPFKALDGSIVNPDVVIISFVPTRGQQCVSYTYTNGATPPDPDFMISPLTYNIAAVTPSYPAVGSVTVLVTSPEVLFRVGYSVTITGLSPSGYNGTFEITGLVNVGGVQGFSIQNATTTAPTLTDATVTVNGVFYEDVDTTEYSNGTWTYWIAGEPGTSGLDVTKTKVRSEIQTLLVQ